MSDSPDLDEVHSLLMHLCEQDLTWSDDAQVCVMEAFNDLSEIHSPDRVREPSTGRAVDRLARTLDLLERLVARSQRLDRTLALMRVRGLITQALDASP